MMNHKEICNKCKYLSDLLVYHVVRIYATRLNMRSDNEYLVLLAHPENSGEKALLSNMFFGTNCCRQSVFCLQTSLDKLGGSHPYFDQHFLGTNFLFWVACCKPLTILARLRWP